jgi:hypothetical protein
MKQMISTLMSPYLDISIMSVHKFQLLKVNHKIIVPRPHSKAIAVAIVLMNQILSKQQSNPLD